MDLFRARNDLQWIFNTEKRIQLVKTVRFSTYINILGEKKSNFLEAGQKSQKNFPINNVKIAEKFIYEIKSDEK